jgi:redox-sensitive bicupin YhaK (pirin superfamily)
MPATHDVQVIRSDQRHHADRGWLDARWHFSFSDYHDPDNVHFGPLRVFNDDVVRGGGGFDMHPHRDMEIVTYVISGRLEHKDHLGNRGVVHPGEVQVMSAGRGIVHAEFNASPTEPVHLLQLWIIPRHKGLPPRWEQRQFSEARRSGRLLPVVSPTEGDAAAGGAGETLKIDQDAMIYVSSLRAGQTVDHTSPAPARKAYLFVIDGAVTLNGDVELTKGDQARVELRDDPTLTLRADRDADLILLDLPA